MQAVYDHHVQDVVASFRELLSPARGMLDGHLDRGALLIAAALDPEVDIPGELSRLDALAAGCGEVSAAALGVRLFGGLTPDPTRHFLGNRSQYYDIDNSLLPRVLDRRIGIPITLSVLMIETARRQGISCHGVGMPGHFLVGSADGYIDPFHGGEVLDEAGCTLLFQRLAGPGAQLPPGALTRTPPAMILKRMLVNLSAIVSAQGQRQKIRAIRALMAAFPDATHRDHVQHAYAAAELGQFDEAAAAAERALVTVPDSVSEKLQAQIDTWLARLN